MLKQLGHHTQTAVNGALALTTLQEHGLHYFDLILMDMQMPIMDGLEATRHIRELECTNSPVVASSPVSRHRALTKRSRVLIIGMSANSDNDTTNLAYEAGIDAFMSKPFTVSTFKSTIESLLKRINVSNNIISTTSSFDV